MIVDLDLEPLLDHIESEIMPEWVAQRDSKKELLAAGKSFDSPVVEDLDDILELFYEKEYRKGLETYINWLLKEGYPTSYEDLEMIIKYGENFSIDSIKLNELRTIYRMPEK